jgi:hypothetical protein
MNISDNIGNNLYCVTMWGNVNDDEGGNGRDTNFLVSASSLEECLELSEHLFNAFICTSDEKKKFNLSFETCAITKLGSFFGTGRQITNHMNNKTYTARLVHGPWVASAVIWGGECTRVDGGKFVDL